MDQTLTLSNKEEWHKWRSEGLGSSDAPVVMGVSPYMTPFQLWQVKTGKKLHVQENQAIEKGNHWEPKVRAMYEIQTGLDFPPKNFEDGALRCSLDGWNEERKEILEIKVPGEEVMQLAREGKVHEKYVYQLEHQLLVTQANLVHFVCATTTGKGAFDGEIEELAIVHYKPNLELREKLFGRLLEFWALVKSETPPPLKDKDYLERTDERAKTLYTEYKKLYEEWDVHAEKCDEIEKKMTEVKQEIIKEMKHTREECAGVQVVKVTQKRVDYKKVEADNALDLEKYKVESSYYRVKVMK